MHDQKEHWAKAAQLGALASVIDPQDTKGFKNRYIAGLRDRAIMELLPDKKIKLMDFGAGSGNLSKSLASEKCQISGIDISSDLLKLAATQNDPEFSAFYEYDGKSIPFKDQSFDYATTYVVLNHITDDQVLTNVLEEIHRVLKSGGILISIEQTRRISRMTDRNIKYQRTQKHFIEQFTKVGFFLKKVKFLRTSRFPLIYPIRYGLIPEKYFKKISHWDAKWSSIFSKPLFNYVDTMFILEKEPTS